MPDPTPSSALAGIRLDIEETVAVYDLDGAGKNSYPISAAMARHAHSLVAALEAVLALADDIDSHGRTRSPVARAAAKSIRRAITTALTGEERSDG